MHTERLCHLPSRQAFPGGGLRDPAGLSAPPLAGLGQRLGLAAVAALLAVGLSACHLPPQPLASAPGAPLASRVAPPPLSPLRPPRHADFGTERASADVRFIANWVADSGDNQQQPFVVVDKKNARVFVFEPGGRLLGSSQVLLGAAKGDDSAPGIGSKPLSQVLPEEKTTPAGRFTGEPGVNASGEDIVWVDYDAAVSMHRVRTANAKERRLERLASATVQDNRISFGCINMPPSFYDNVLSPQFKDRYGVVYVLPDVRRVTQVFVQAYDPAVRYRTAMAAAAASRRAEAAAAKRTARL